jgi:hypothetical protein
MKRQFDFKKTWVIFPVRPIELKEYWRRPRIKSLTLFDLLIVLELVFIELESSAGHVDLGGTNWSQVAPGNRVQKVRVQEFWALENQVRVEV